MLQEQQGLTLKVIGHIHTAFKTKFGVPRQSGLVEELEATIVFTPQYRDPSALRGLEGFSHLWLIWEFSEAKREQWSPTVRPPRLGGNKRVGVFATRSPFRPNALGLSVVRLIAIEQDKENGMVLRVAGADLMDGTPIYDIKPYLPFVDSIADAQGGFAEEVKDYHLDVECSLELLEKIPSESQKGLLGVLAHDPRPQYQTSEERIYGMCYDKWEVKFQVKGQTLIVTEIELCEKNDR
ncbi:MAG: tRNA (N6-threonylcarbamoyladenosine(37)-N6)-methyltransferase TrmO [Clostridia bacterium]|nr:tRNA (N6-threonylcarbamoyladenosine(37)-N6)-methyltransferase TrmO [Clostridia bacterium]